MADFRKFSHATYLQHFHIRTEWSFLKPERERNGCEVSRGFRNDHWMRVRIDAHHAAFSLAGFRVPQESQPV